MFTLKSSMDLTLKYRKEFLKISLRIKSGEPRNCRFYCIFTFPYAVILLFLKNYLRYLNSDLTKTLLSACSIRWKNDFLNFLNCFTSEFHHYPNAIDFTYESSLGNRSYIDHFLYSTELCNKITNVQRLLDGHNLSDHHPLVLNFNFNPD